MGYGYGACVKLLKRLSYLVMEFIVLRLRALVLRSCCHTIMRGSCLCQAMVHVLHREQEPSTSSSIKDSPATAFSNSLTLCVTPKPNDNVCMCQMQSISTKKLWRDRARERERREEDVRCGYAEGIRYYLNRSKRKRRMKRLK